MKTAGKDYAKDFGAFKTGLEKIGWTIDSVEHYPGGRNMNRCLDGTDDCVKKWASSKVGASKGAGQSVIINFRSEWY